MQRLGGHLYKRAKFVVVVVVVVVVEEGRRAREDPPRGQMPLQGARERRGVASLDGDHHRGVGQLPQPLRCDVANLAEV